MNLIERNGDIQYLIELDMRNRSKQEKLNRHQRRKEGCVLNQAGISIVFVMISTSCDDESEWGMKMESYIRRESK